MKNLVIIFFLILVIIQTLIFSQQKSISGSWIGKLKIPPGVELTIVFKISEASNKKFLAKLDSPDQGAKDIPCGDIWFEKDSLRIDVPIVGGFYQGRIEWEQKSITGIWKQAGQQFVLNLKYTETYSGLNRPQEPKPPFPYRIEEVLIENKKDDIYLSGTLTMPDNGEDFTAIILISGSGAQNRDQEIFGHKPFLVLADFLTKNGFAVLRFDDRGFGASTGDFSKSTTFDFANDVIAAVEFLQSKKEINPKKIGLLGHSEGSMVAQIVAANYSENISFVIMLAGVGIPGDELILLQSEKIALSEGIAETKIQNSLTNQKKIISLLKSNKANQEIEKEIRDIIYALFDNSYIENEKANFEKMIDNQIRILTSQWYRTFLKFNPTEFLQKIKCPVLALNGEKDVQVPARENLEAIKNSLIKSGNTNITILELKGLNHLFQNCETGSISEYGKIEQTISQSALDSILNWLIKITR